MEAVLRGPRSAGSGKIRMGRSGIVPYLPMAVNMKPPTRTRFLRRLRSSSSVPATTNEAKLPQPASY